jgi:DNA-binding ferritin-like protein
MKEITFLDASHVSILFAFDCWMLHHNVHGPSFKEVHEFLGEFYTRALEDRDYLVEHAILTKEIDTAPNMTEVFRIDPLVKAWDPLPARLYSVKEAMDAVKKQWVDYKEIFAMVREYAEKNGHNDIASDIDSMVSAWELDIGYKAMKTSQ